MCFAALSGNRSPWLLLTSAALTAGCTLSLGPATGEPPHGELAAYTGTLQPSCSPVDAIALGLELEAVQPGDPTQISLLLWPPGDFQRGAVIGLGEPSGPTAAAIWAGDTEWHLAVAGGLWVDAFQPEGKASGRLRLEFEGGKRLEGSFQASWSDPGPVFCG